MKTVALAQAVAVLGVVDPDVTTAGAHVTGWIDGSKFSDFMAIIMAGTLGASATLDAKIEQATNGSGAGAGATRP